MLEALTPRVLTPAVSPIIALLFSRTPSTSMAVPNDALPRSDEPLRKVNLLSFIKEGFTLLPPGKSWAISPKVIIC